MLKIIYGVDVYKEDDRLSAQALSYLKGEGESAQLLQSIDGEPDSNSSEWVNLKKNIDNLRRGYKVIAGGALVFLATSVVVAAGTGLYFFMGNHSESDQSHDYDDEGPSTSPSSSPSFSAWFLPSSSSSSSASASSSFSSSPSGLPSVSAFPSLSSSPSGLPSVSAFPSLSSSPSGSRSVSASSSLSGSPSISMSSSFSNSPSISISSSLSGSRSVTPSSSLSSSPSISMSSSLSGSPSISMSSSLSGSPSISASPSLSSSASISMSSSLSGSPSISASSSFSSSPSISISSSFSGSPSVSISPSPSASPGPWNPNVCGIKFEMENPSTDPNDHPGFHLANHDGLNCVDSPQNLTIIPCSGFVPPGGMQYFVSAYPHVSYTDLDYFVTNITNNPCKIDCPSMDASLRLTKEKCFEPQPLGDNDGTTLSAFEQGQLQTLFAYSEPTAQRQQNSSVKLAQNFIEIMYGLLSELDRQGNSMFVVGLMGMMGLVCLMIPFFMKLTSKPSNDDRVTEIGHEEAAAMQGLKC